VRTFPALDVSWSEPPPEDVLELLLAVVDDHDPTAAGAGPAATSAMST